MYLSEVSGLFIVGPLSLIDSLDDRSYAGSPFSASILFSDPVIGNLAFQITRSRMKIAMNLRSLILAWLTAFLL